MKRVTKYNDHNRRNPRFTVSNVMLAGSRTEKNLAAAFAKKSESRNIYTFYASVARKQGYEQISALFLETAENCLNQAQLLMEQMNDDHRKVDIMTTVTAFKIESTYDNLRAAVRNEKEMAELYPRWIEVAEKEGLKEIAALFAGLNKVSKDHETRFATLQDHVYKTTVFKRQRVCKWKCRNCGYVHEGPEAPRECPACGHPQSFYEIKEVLE